MTEVVFRGRLLAHFLFADERQYSAGNVRALVDAMKLCAQAAEPLPNWAASALIVGLARIDNLEVRSWDEIFGRPHPKGTRLKDARRHHELLLPVYEYVESRIAELPNAASTTINIVGEPAH